MTKNQRTAFVETLRLVTDMNVTMLMTDTLLEGLRRGMFTAQETDVMLTCIRRAVGRAETMHEHIQPLVQILEGGSHE